MNPFARIRISALTRKRLRNFYAMRRARVALYLLLLLFGISLIAEVLCNSRPLYLKLDGKHYLPFVQRLSLQQLTNAESSSSSVNYHALTASAAYRANPANRVLWAPVPYSPTDVVNPDTLYGQRRVTLAVVPDAMIGRLNLLPDGTIIRPVGVEPFFPAQTQIAGLRLADHWQLTPELNAALQRHAAGGAQPAEEFVLRHRTQPDLQARVTLPERLEFAQPDDAQKRGVRLMLRQMAPIEAPLELRFKLRPEFARTLAADTAEPQPITAAMVAPLRQRAWQQVPAAQRAELLELAAAAFADTAPRAQIAWRETHATVSCALQPIAWPYPPVQGHWMGIDAAGRDVLVRVLYGMRIALLFGLSLACWATFGGLVYGAIQGYFGGWLDVAGQRITEIWSALPFLYVMIFLGSALGRGFMILLVCYSLFNWIGISYYMRAEFFRLRARTFVEAARCQGLSAARIIFSHILPNALTPLITLFPFTLIGAIGSLAALDFLGFGLPPLTPSWGELLQQAQQFRWAWWLILFPSLALFCVMLLTVLIGEGLRDAFDPRQRSRLE